MERLVIVGSDELLGRPHGGAHGERARYVGDGRRDVQVGEVIVARLGRLLLERAQVVVLVLEVVLVVAERLAVLTRLMGAAVPAGAMSVLDRS